MKGKEGSRDHKDCVSFGCDRAVLSLGRQKCSVRAGVLWVNCPCSCPSTRCTVGRCATLRTRAGSARWSRTSCPSPRRPTSARTTTSPSSMCPSPSSPTATPPPSCTTSTGSVSGGTAEPRPGTGTHSSGDCARGFKAHCQCECSLGLSVAQLTLWTR